MKKLLFTALSSLMLIQTGFAISPLDRSIHEITDIIRSSELRRMLPPMETIIDIQRVPRGYVITTNRFQVIVDVLYGPRGAQATGEEGGTPTYNYHEPTEKK
jgi:hypothetical protein